MCQTSDMWRVDVCGVVCNVRGRDVVSAKHIAAACVGITHALGLRFSAIDLVLDRAGVYCFLEANPNGQWAWIESRTGLPIAGAIVDELQAIAAR